MIGSTIAVALFLIHWQSGKPNSKPSAIYQKWVLTNGIKWYKIYGIKWYKMYKPYNMGRFVIGFTTLS